MIFQSTPSAWRETAEREISISVFVSISIHSLRMEGDSLPSFAFPCIRSFQSTPSAWRETKVSLTKYEITGISIHSLRMEGDVPFVVNPDGTVTFQSTPSAWRETTTESVVAQKANYFNPLPPHGGRQLDADSKPLSGAFQSTPSAWRETSRRSTTIAATIFQSTPSAWRETPISALELSGLTISIHSLRMEGDSKTAQESVFHFAYPCTILQKRMQKTTFCTRKNGFFRKKGEKFGAKPSASFCAPMIRTDTFPLNFSHRISGSSMSMVSFAPICSTFD